MYILHVLLNQLYLVKLGDVVYVVAHRQNHIVLFDLFCIVQLALQHVVLSYLVGQTLEHLELFMVVNQQLHASSLVLEGDGLSLRVRASHAKQLFGDHLAVFELVGDHYWNLVEVFYYWGAFGGVLAQHNVLDCASSCNAVLRVEGPTALLAKVTLDRFDDDGDSGCLAYQLDEVHLLGVQA